MDCIHVDEDLPPPGKFCWCYTEVFQRYDVARWNPATGWTNIKGDQLKTITHWFNIELPMPFENLDRLDNEMAVKYKLIDE